MEHPFSYSSVVRPALKKWVIYNVENMTGRKELLRRTDDVDEDFQDGHNFWDVMCTRFDVKIAASEQPHKIPATGPVLIVVNHPNGILDGLAMGKLLRSVRPDFKILAQSVFNQVEPLREHILPVSFGETDEAQKINLQTRRDAIDYLKAGGCVCVFPAGGVSTSRRMFGKAKDTRWRNFTAKLACVPDVTVVPVYINGQNSRLFHVVSRASDTLRKAMLLHEFRRRLGSTVQLVIGEPLKKSELARRKKDPVAMMEFLYRQTYALAPFDALEDGYGYEFDKRYRH